MENARKLSILVEVLPRSHVRVPVWFLCCVEREWEEEHFSKIVYSGGSCCITCINSFCITIGLFLYVEITT